MLAQIRDGDCKRMGRRCKGEVDVEVSWSRSRSGELASISFILKIQSSQVLFEKHRVWLEGMLPAKSVSACASSSMVILTVKAEA